MSDRRNLQILPFSEAKVEKKNARVPPYRTTENLSDIFPKYVDQSAESLKATAFQQTPRENVRNKNPEISQITDLWEEMENVSYGHMKTS